MHDHAVVIISVYCSIIHAGKKTAEKVGLIDGNRFELWVCVVYHQHVTTSILSAG